MHSIYYNINPTSTYMTKNLTIYRVWHNNQWYYDFEAISSLLEELYPTQPINYTGLKLITLGLKRIRQPELLSEITIIDAYQVLDLLQERLRSKENIRHIFETRLAVGKERFKDREEFEKDAPESFSMMGKTKEDYLDALEHILQCHLKSDLELRCSAVGLSFDVYDLKTKQPIPQLRRTEEAKI